MSQPHLRRQLIAGLTRKLQEIERAHPHQRGRQSGAAVVSTGICGLDRLLPGEGLRGGTLVEWLAEGDGTGTGTLALTLVQPFLRQKGGVLIVIDDQRRFYAPAVAGLGIDLAGTLLVQPRSARHTLWALEQSLRCPGVGAVACWIDQIDSRSFRRLQLAAETGGGVGLLLRPAAFRRQPSWAEVRLFVQPLPLAVSPSEPLKRRLRVTLFSCRSGGNTGEIELDIDDEGLVRMAPRVASAADQKQATGA